MSVSFTTVWSAVHDHQLVTKLQFISLAPVMQPYLQKCHADVPMLPLSLLKYVFAGICKAQCIRVIKQSCKIAKLNVSDAAGHVKPANIDVGFAVTGTLAWLLRQKKVSDLQNVEFRK